MKPHSLILLALFLLSSHALFAQAAGNAIYGNNRTASEPQQRSYFINDSTMVLGVNVLMNVKADSYVAIFGLTQVGASIDSTNIMMNERVNGFIDDLKRLGIGRDEIHVDLVSQIPTFDYQVESRIFSRTYNEVPTGFDLKKNIHVGFKKAEMIDDILLEAAKHEIYDIVKVEYVVDDIENIYDSLRGAAVRVLGKKIKDMERLGVKFTSMYQTVGEVTNSISPIERYVSYSAYSTTRPNVRKPLIGSATVNEAKKPVTLYYNRLPYNTFDIVINPELIEPGVQFTYNLSMRYVLKKG